MVRYYGYYSNESCGMRKKAGRDNEVSALIDSDVSRKAFRKNWARLIQKIYNVDPLVCPRCHGQLSGVWISSGDLGREAKPPEHSSLPYVFIPAKV